jgi:hypothetical protein
MQCRSRRPWTSVPSWGGEDAFYEDVAGELEMQQRRCFGKGSCSLRVVAAPQDGGQLAYDMLQSMDDGPDTRESAVRLPKDRRLVPRCRRRNALVSAYDGWVRQRLEAAEGNYAAMLGSMFNELRGGPAAVLDQMRQEIEAFYGRLLKRMHPRPGVAGAQRFHPLMIAGPGLLVDKKRGRTLDVEDAAINDGLHVHAVLVASERSRLGRDVAAGINEHQS